MSFISRNIRLRVWDGKILHYQDPGASNSWTIFSSNNKLHVSISFLGKTVISTQITQSTNNVDKEDFEIFEGDFLQFENGDIGLVRYEEDYGQYIVEKKWNKNQHHINLNCDSAYGSKVIGNIFTNPELEEELS